MGTESKRETTDPSGKWLDPGTQKGLVGGPPPTTEQLRGSFETESGSWSTTKGESVTTITGAWN